MSAKITANRKKLSIAGRATVRLRDLVRISVVLRQSGEIIDTKSWLKVIANTLSAVPPRTNARDPFASLVELKLTPKSLTYYARTCCLTFTTREIREQFVDTKRWRQELDETIPKMMRMDTVGKVLGITESVRDEAQAWNIGTYCGSSAARKRAKRKREKLALSRKRRTQNVMDRKSYEAQSLSRRKPWEAEGISRRTWERRKKSERERVASLSAFENVASLSAAISEDKNGVASLSAPIMYQDASTYGLASLASRKLNARVEPWDSTKATIASRLNVPKGLGNKVGLQESGNLEDLVWLGPIPGGLADQALKKLYATKPPRDYDAINASVRAARERKLRKD